MLCKSKIKEPKIAMAIFTPTLNCKSNPNLYLKCNPNPIDNLQNMKE